MRSFSSGENGKPKKKNIQSRLRGAILYGRSNQTGAMVINTSNKSELAVGYSTLYGDSVGAVSLLGDLYKSQVYDLARHLVKTRGGLPMAYIERPPSAELRENQQDSQSLPPYEKLDAKKINPEQHFTAPPPRYTEASLVKRLEELGIGRPSTYASIIGFSLFNISASVSPTLIDWPSST